MTEPTQPTAAEGRDLAAAERDTAAEVRDAESVEAAEADRENAAQDRAAAALDRQDAAADRREAEELMQDTHRDRLTGAFVRSAGIDLFNAAIDRARRDGENLTMMFVDVDHLKSVNDQYGHAAGDRVLTAVGAAFRQGLRSYDIVVRYGGDEFVCALPGLGLGDAEGRAEQLHTILAASETGASVSVGFAELREDESLDAVIGRADREMYARRRTRRDADGSTGRDA